MSKLPDDFNVEPTYRHPDEDAVMDAPTAEDEIYRRGFEDGVTAYAHWKDGVQYVGTTGRRLVDAIAEDKIERTWNYEPPSGPLAFEEDFRDD
jgi:hypothetical protein